MMKWVGVSISIIIITTHKSLPINHMTNEVKQKAKETGLEARGKQKHHYVKETTYLVCYWLTEGKPWVCYQRRWFNTNLVALLRPCCVKAAIKITLANYVADMSPPTLHVDPTQRGLRQLFL